MMEIASVLSAAGVRRDMLYAPGQGSALSGGTGLSVATIDEALGQLAEWSLLSFTVNGLTVIVHRLVMRVVRERLAEQGRLSAVCRAAIGVLDGRNAALQGSQDRPIIRDFPEQAAALQQAAAGLADDLVEPLLRMRGRSLYFLNQLGDSVRQAVAIGEPLIEDAERVLGPDHPLTLASRGDPWKRRYERQYPKSSPP
jgi:hypothetical protein